MRAGGCFETNGGRSRHLAGRPHERRSSDATCSDAAAAGHPDPQPCVLRRVELSLNVGSQFDGERRLDQISFGHVHASIGERGDQAVPRAVDGDVRLGVGRRQDFAAKFATAGSESQGAGGVGSVRPV